MASKSLRKDGHAAVDAGFLLRLKALEELNKTLPAELRLSINQNQISGILPRKETTKPKRRGLG